MHHNFQFYRAMMLFPKLGRTNAPAGSFPLRPKNWPPRRLAAWNPLRRNGLRSAASWPRLTNLARREFGLPSVFAADHRQAAPKREQLATKEMSLLCAGLLTRTRPGPQVSILDP